MISNYFNTTATIQHITKSTNDDGCEVETISSNEVIPCFMYRLSGNKVYVNTVNSHMITDQLWCNSSIPALAESFDVTFITGCTSSGNIEITLGSTATVTIAVTSTGETTPNLVANAIASGTYPGWSVTHTDDTVNFTSLTGGVQTPSVIDTNATGVTQQAAHFVEVGANSVALITLTDKILYNGILYWVENVNTVIDQQLGQYIDLSKVI